MKLIEVLLTVSVLFFVTLFLGSCATDDDNDGFYEDSGIICPEPSEILGEYAFCVWASNPPKGEEAIVWDGTTPIGNYEAGTQITVEAVQEFEFNDFFGWYLDSDEPGPISQENPYTFTLDEDTYIYVVYSVQY